jgi:hypothetical protein
MEEHIRRKVSLGWHVVMHVMRGRHHPRRAPIHVHRRRLLHAHHKLFVSSHLKQSTGQVINDK